MGRQQLGGKSRWPALVATKGTVIVVDDDKSVRKSLSRILRSASYSAICFESVLQFQQSSFPTEPTCIILDLQMPHATGLDLQSELISQEYYPPIIFLTGYGDVRSSVAAMKNGAFDFLEKPVDDTLLLTTIDRALAQDVVTRAAMTRKAELQDAVSSLTRREYEVLTHVIAGRLNKQIATDLAISEKTVKVHRGRVMKKAGVRSVAELTRLCDEIGVAPINVR